MFILWTHRDVNENNDHLFVILDILGVASPIFYFFIVAIFFSYILQPSVDPCSLDGM